MMGHERFSLGPLEQEQLLQQIGGDILSVLREGWREVTYSVNLIEGYLEESLEVAYDGQEVRKERAPLSTMQ